jgi:peptidyl-prolyl cis-trans isomerase SurA
MIKIGALQRNRTPHLRRVTLSATACLGLMFCAAALPATAVAAAAVPVPPAETTHIVAVVNGDVITNVDVDNRTRLFALSTGLPLSSDILERLKPQILRQLVDERLRMQEVQRRKIVVPDKDIAAAMTQIEQRNNMAPGTLRAKLTSDGVSLSTLVDQIRTQLGWTQVLRQQLGDQAQVTSAQVAEQQRLQDQLTGKPEYRVGEIFIPVEDPANQADAERFAETVIDELHKGAPFPLVAAQFSQTQTALQGGEMGWVQPNQLDPVVADMVAQMPVGAISNPVRVPGGYSIVTVQAKRDIGKDFGTVVSMRQVFLPFTTTLNPQAPTDQQRQVLEKARSISASVHSCDQMEQVAKANNSTRPPDPGDVQLESVNPAAFRQLLATLPYTKASEPLVATDGIAVVIVCSREQKNLAAISDAEMRQIILAGRVELTSRQLQAELRRTATIQIRHPSGT